jgi:hypothetical protein
MTTEKDVLDDYKNKPVALMIIMTLGIAGAIIGIIYGAIWLVDFLWGLIFIVPIR